jgi:signal transduction histidine kinase
MQATQSSTASEIAGSKNISGQFAALQHMSHVMELGCDKGLWPPGRGIRRVAESAGLAHDAGNLLGALTLYSELLAMPGVLHDEHKDYAAEIRLLSERSWAMIDRLVNHAQSELEADAGSVVLLEVVERCHGLLGKIAGREVDIMWNAGGFRAVNIATEAAERIITNLVKNAAEASSGDGVIVVSVTGLMVDGIRRVLLTVSDSGCGMSESMLKALRTGAITRGGGRGIGFSVVRELVAATGGRLEIASEPGVGTSVSVEWAALAQGDSVRASRVSGGSVSAEFGAKAVLKAEAGWIAC